MADFLDDLAEDWVGGENAEPPAEATETPPEPVAEEAKAEPEAPQDEEKPAEESEPKAEPHSVPYSAMKKERERAQAAERELERLRSQVPVQQPTQPVYQPQSIPDPYEDPQGYDAYVKEQIASEAFALRAEMSGERAEEKHGKETVVAAIEWAQAQAQTDPGLGLKVRNHRDPVGYLVKGYQQSLTLETIAGRTFEEAAKDYATQQGWIVSPEAQPSASQTPSSVPPRSLARVPGSGGNKTTPSGADWGEVKFPLG